MRAAYCVIALAITATNICAAESDKNWGILRGDALTQAFANQEFADGIHFAYQFSDNGVVTGMDMGKTVQGRWRVRGNQLCWQWNKSKDPEACYQVRRQGLAVSLITGGQEVLSGTMTPLVASTDVTR